MKKYFKKLDNGKWKVYLQLFFKKGTKFRLHLKPGITQFVDGDARIYFNKQGTAEAIILAIFFAGIEFKDIR